MPLVVISGAFGIVLVPSESGAAPPTELIFQSPPQAVTAGQTVTLQWGAVPSGDFVIFSMSKPYPSGFDFSSPLQVVWPNPPGGSWNGTYGFWASTSSSAAVVIPSTSVPATKFTFQLITCNFETGCSNDDQATLTVVDMATWGTSSMGVIAGTTASLHWQAPKSGDFFLLTMPSSTYSLNFSSSAVVTWPNPTGGTWNQTYGLWVTTSAAVSISVPQGASPGASFTFNLFTCNLSSGLCSNSHGGPGVALVTMSVVGSEWSAAPFQNGYTQSMAVQSSGDQPFEQPLDAAISPSSDTSYDNNEFSNSVGVAAPGATTLAPKDNAWDNANSPFASPWLSCGLPCGPSTISELGERVVVDASGLVWFTQGGALFYTGSTPNHSEVVAYDPSSGGMCTYGVPGNNPEVVGLVATGSGAGETIWFAAIAAQSLESFQPSQVGENCASSPYYNLSGQSSFRQVPLSVNPAMVSADPNATTLWVTGFTNEIDRVDTSTGIVTRYAYSANNRYYPHAFPWQIASDGTYAYAIDYGDDNLVRINVATGHIDETPIPVVSDTEEGYGLTMVNIGSDSRLYFTLSQDPALSTTSTFGMATAFGWVDLTSWNAGSSQPSQAVVYSGLDAAVSPSAPSDFRGISSGPTGDLAVADSSKGGPEGVIHLSP